MSERQKIIDKVRALLAKTVSNGCSEHESMAAAAKAQQMMDEYDLLHLDLKEKSSFTTTENKNAKYNMVKRVLTGNVAKFCHCRVIYIDKDAVIFGHDSDVLMAEWLTETLERFINRELRAHIKKAGYMPPQEAKSEKNGFLVGALTRIIERLEELTPKEMNESMNALIISKTAEVDAKYEEYKAALGSKIVPIQFSNKKWCSDTGLASGKDAGDKATFSRPITAKTAATMIS